MSHKVFPTPKRYEDLPQNKEEITPLDEMLSMLPGDKQIGRALIGIYIELKNIRELMEKNQIPY